MRILIDASPLGLYKGWSRGDFHGGTETMVKVLASGLAARGHQMHVVTGDIESDEQRSPNEHWWPLAYHPQNADAVVMIHNLEALPRNDYSADLLILATNGIDPNLGGFASGVDAYPVFSEKHAELMCQARPEIDRSKCFITGLGVDARTYGVSRSLPPYPKVPGRIFIGNDPQRGLWHVLDIFDKLKPMVPHATLHVGYDVGRVFEALKWHSLAMAEVLWDCMERLEHTEGVVSVGALSREQVVKEQLDCEVHVWPSDPPNIGSQIHGLTQLECAASGAALVLSDTEALPEVFGAAATILPVPGTYAPEAERRVDAQDWAEAVAELMLDEQKWREANRRSRTLAETMTWEHVLEEWDSMLRKLAPVAV